jgi:uncharacterized protein
VAKEIFIDTGAWLALVDRSDQFHTDATDIYRTVLKQPGKLVTTNLIIAETYNLIHRHVGYTQAIKFLESLRKTSRLIKVYANEVLDTEAEETLRNYKDQDFSLTDAISFAVMHERGITEAFTFDHHFQIAGFVWVQSSLV